MLERNVLKLLIKGPMYGAQIVVDRDIYLVNVRLPLLIKERSVVIVGVEGMI
jgi:hypothetical protein